jgi:transcription elongation factor SPT5
MINNMGSWTPGRDAGASVNGLNTPIGTPYLSHSPGLSVEQDFSGSSSWDPAITGTPLLQAQESNDAASVAPSAAYSPASGAYSVSDVSSDAGGFTPSSTSAVSSYGSYISSASDWSSSQVNSDASINGAPGSSSRWDVSAPPVEESATAASSASAPSKDRSGPSYDTAYQWIQRTLVLSGTSTDGVEVTGSVVSREDNMCRLKLLNDSGTVVTVTDWQTLQPVKPKKRDKVKIVSGEFMGLAGRLINIDNNDGIVEMLDMRNEIQIIEMKELATMVES